MFTVIPDVDHSEKAKSPVGEEQLENMGTGAVMMSIISEPLFFLSTTLKLWARHGSPLILNLIDTPNGTNQLLHSATPWRMQT